MKTQKRDRTNRLYHRGYHAGLTGKSRDLCPFINGEPRQQWLAGWREGRIDQWQGMQGVSVLHKVAHI